MSAQELRNSRLVFYPLSTRNPKRSFWRCLSHHLGGNKPPLQLQKDYCTAAGVTRKSAGEPSLEDIKSIEQVFSISIIIIKILSLPKEGQHSPPSWEIVQRWSLPLSNKSMALNYSGGVYSLILDWDRFCKYFKCPLCSRIVRRGQDLKSKKHKCDPSPTVLFPKAQLGFRPKKSLFERLEDFGFSMPSSLRYYSPTMVFDCESINDKPPEAKPSVKSVHRCIMISAATNIDGFTEVKTFLDLKDQDAVCESFVSYAEAVSDAVFSRQLRLVQPLLDAIDASLAAAAEDKSRRKLLHRLREDAIAHIRLLRIYGMWSSTYDIPLLIPSLCKRLNDAAPFVIKSNSKYILLNTPKLSFRDIACFMSCSLREFLAAWKTDQQKLYFPWSLFKDESFLHQSSPWPPIEAFQPQPTQEEWNHCKTIFETEARSSWLRYLQIYCEHDTAPLIVAFDRMRLFWMDKFQVCINSEAFTISSLAQIITFKNINPSSAVIFRPTYYNQGFYQDLKDNIRGGYSTSIQRVAVGGMTNTSGPLGGKLCNHIRGWDANGLYSGLLGSDLPVGIGRTWKKDQSGDFVAKSRYLPSFTSYGEYIFVQWLEFQLAPKRVVHAFNHGQMRFGDSRYRPDAWVPADNTVYHYNGCAFHHHQGCTKTTNSNDRQKQLQLRDKAASAFYHQLGIKEEHVFDCQFKEQLKQDPELRQFVADHIKLPFSHHKKLSKTTMLEALSDGTMFGTVKFSGHIDESQHHLYDQTIPPFFTSAEVKIEQLSPYQQRLFATDPTQKPTRTTLLAVKSIKDAVVSSSLFQFYLGLPGFVLDDLEYVVEFKRGRPFADVIQRLVQLRKDADADPDKKVMGEMAKICLNSAYGKSLINQEKQRKLHILSEDQLIDSNRLNRANFGALDPIPDTNFFELSCLPTRYTVDNCILIGHTVLCNSKRHLLSFAYWLRSLFSTSPRDLAVILADTDSLYCSLPAETLESSLPDDAREKYHAEKHLYLVLEPKDKRTSLLWKVENHSQAIISLAPKCYICFNISTTDEALCVISQLRKLKIFVGNEHNVHSMLWNAKEAKITAKGVNISSQKKLDFEHYLSVLVDSQPYYMSVEGIQRDRTLKRMVSYAMRKKALSCLNFKTRNVNLVNTEPLY